MPAAMACLLGESVPVGCGLQGCFSLVFSAYPFRFESQGDTRLVAHLHENLSKRKLAFLMYSSAKVLWFFWTS